MKSTHRCSQCTLYIVIRIKCTTGNFFKKLFLMEVRHIMEVSHTTFMFLGNCWVVRKQHHHKIISPLGRTAFRPIKKMKIFLSCIFHESQRRRSTQTDYKLFQLCIPSSKENHIFKKLNHLTFLNCYQNYISFRVSEIKSLELDKVKIK